MVNTNETTTGHLRGGTTKKLTDIPKVVGLVFFGRRATVSIMDCYLKVRASSASPCGCESLLDVMYLGMCSKIVRDG